MALGELYYKDRIILYKHSSTSILSHIPLEFIAPIVIILFIEGRHSCPILKMGVSMHLVKDLRVWKNCHLQSLSLYQRRHVEAQTVYSIVVSFW